VISDRDDALAAVGLRPIARRGVPIKGMRVQAQCPGGRFVLDMGTSADGLEIDRGSDKPQKTYPQCGKPGTVRAGAAMVGQTTE
jgi:hypothetical protein